MRIKLTLLAALAGVPALFLVGTGTGSALTTKSKAKSAKITCVTKDIDQSPGELKGVLYGAARCSAPYGKGFQVATYDEKVSSTGSVTSKGAFKNYFDTGTVHGVYSLKGKATSATAVTLSGPVRITGGTGAFKGAKAKGKLTCSTSDGGHTQSCTAVVKPTAV